MPHYHTGPFENFVRQEEACISVVNNYPDGTLINCSELSRKFDLKFSDGRTPSNAGECMKKLLKFHNVDLIRLAEFNRNPGTNKNTRGMYVMF